MQRFRRELCLQMFIYSWMDNKIFRSGEIDEIISDQFPFTLSHIIREYAPSKYRFSPYLFLLILFSITFGSILKSQSS